MSVYSYQTSQKQFLKFREKWDFKEVSKQQLKRIRKKASEKFHEALKIKTKSN